MKEITNRTIQQVDQQKQNSVCCNPHESDQGLAEQALNQFLKTNVMDILEPLQFQILQLRIPPSQINTFAYNWLKDKYQKQKDIQFLDDDNRELQEAVQPDQVFYYRVKEKLKKPKMQKFRYGVSGESSGKKFMRFSKEGLLCFDDGDPQILKDILESINPLTVQQSSKVLDKSQNQFEKNYILQGSKRTIFNQKIKSFRAIKGKTDGNLSSKKTVDFQLKNRKLQYNINMEPRVSEDLKTKNTQLTLLVQLRKCVFFKELDQDSVKKIINCMDRRTIQPLEIIYQNGDTIDQFMIIQGDSNFQLVKKGEDNNKPIVIKRGSALFYDKQQTIYQKSNRSSLISQARSDRSSFKQDKSEERSQEGSRKFKQPHRKGSNFSNLSALSKISHSKRSNFLNFILKSQNYLQSQAKKSQQILQINKIIGQEDKKKYQQLLKDNQWNFFGQMALLYPTQADGTLIYKGEQQATIWTLNRLDYSFVLKQKAQQKLRLCCQVFNKAEILSTLTIQQKVKLAEISIQKNYHKDSFVIREGQIGNCFYLVVSGNLVAQKAEKKSKQIKPVYYYSHGDYFGEIALVRNVPRQASVKALTSCKLIVIQRNGFRRIFGPLEKVLRRNENQYMHIKKQLTRISLQSRINAIQKNIKPEHQK